MSTSGKIHRISVSMTKGSKKRNIEEALIVENSGIQGDAHAGSERQVSLLPLESFEKVKNDIIDIVPGDFAENITTTGVDFSSIQVGSRLTLGDGIKLVVTQIGKECHEDCQIREIVGDCIMPREGVFARVESGGKIRTGDPIRWE